MKCPECEAGNPELARFCLNCGEALQSGLGHACPRCGGDIPGSAYYCPGCGRPVEGMGDSSSLGRGAAISADALQRLMPKQYLRQLLAQKGKVGGERRVVTMLFFDVVDSTGIAESLDPEDVVEVMNGAFEVLVKPIYRYKGTLARLMGDGVLSFFGAPVAHEDDPIRACRAALDIVAAASVYAEQLRRERGIEHFDVRVGINTGLVVVGEVGADLRVEYTAMGDAVNLAARMESAAEPGTVLITDNTRRLLGDDFETRDMGRIQVKGKSDPVQTFAVVRALARTTAAGAGTRSPLVGRESELSRLFKAIHAVKQGQGAVAAVTAEPGVGKTRLVAETRGARSEDVSWSEGRCASYTADVSYWVAGEILRGLLGVDLTTDPLHVERALHEGTAGVPELFFPLARVLGLPGDDSGEGDAGDRIVGAYRDYIEQIAAERPVVLVWENLHWADARSLEILGALVSLTAAAPVLLLVTWRSGGKVARGLEDRIAAASGGSLETLTLGPLGRADSAKLLHNLVDGREIPGDVLGVILESAEGNAFFLEEILRSLLDAGLLAFDGTRVVASAPLASLDIPDTVHGAIMSRVDRLFPREKRTLQSASVIGRAFPHEILTRVAGDDVGHDQVGDSIASLRSQDFLREQTEDDTVTSAAGRFEAGESLYMFNNSMTADVVYDSMLRSQRRELHERTGRAIEQMFAGRTGDIAPLLAYHYEKSAAVDKAFEHTLGAAARAARMYANDEAAARYRRALELAEKEDCDLPAGAILAAHEGLGDVHFVTSDYAAALEQYDLALGLRDGPPVRVRLNRKKGQLCEKWGRYEEASRFFEAAMADLAVPIDTTEAAHIYGGLGMACYRAGDIDEAFKHLRMAEEMMDAAGNRPGLAAAHNNLGMACGRKGDWAAAADHLSRSLAIREDLRDTYGLAASHNNLGLIHHRRGDLDAAAFHLESSLGLFQQLGNQHGLARAYDNLSQVHMDRGDEERAMELVKKSVAILAEISMDNDEILPEMWQSGEW